MHCESCWKGGYDRDTMSVDPARRIFLGPCCEKSVIPAGPVDQEARLTYGVEISSKNGLVAFTKYGGLSIQYHKPPEELERWVQGIQSYQSL